MMHLKKVIKNVLLKICVPICEENLKVQHLTSAVRYSDTSANENNSFRNHIR